MADADPQLDLKKRARRRLVGAIALAVLAAIILPVVMDKEPRNQRPDIQVRIPSQEGANFTAQSIQGRETSTPPAASAKPPVTTASSAVAAQALPEPVAQSPNTASRPTAEVADTHSPSPEEKPQAVPPSPKPAKPEVSARSEDGQRAAALLGEKPVEEKTAFLIQIGVFKDAANAQAARTSAKGAGVATYQEAVGKAMRVRAGPFASREAADKAAAKLHKAGLQAVVQARP